MESSVSIVRWASRSSGKRHGVVHIDQRLNRLELMALGNAFEQRSNRDASAFFLLELPVGIAPLSNHRVSTERLDFRELARKSVAKKNKSYLSY